jgi:O-antigen ligase
MPLQNLNVPKWQMLMGQICGWSAVGLVFSATFSRALYALSGLLFVIAWITQNDLRSRLMNIKSLAISPPALFIVAMVLTWSTWSTAPSGDVLNNIKVYSKMLMVLMLVSTFSDPQWRQRGWWGFTAGMALVLGSTFANIVVDLPWSKTHNQGLGVNHSVFVEYVSQSVMTAVFLAFTIQRTWAAKEVRTRIIWGCASLLALFSVTFLLQGRSGLVASAVVIAVMTMIYTPPARRWPALMLMLIALTLLVMSSPLMLERVLQGYREVVQHEAFSSTSLGARMDMWLLALNNFWAHPLLGTGVGSYHQIAATHFSTIGSDALIYYTIHPHNQYLFFAMEYGIAGLIAFCWLLWRLAKTAYFSSNSERSILFATTAVLAVDSLFNVPLWYRAESFFFYAILGLLVASNLSAQGKAGFQSLRADNLMKS